jgi:hypothetical protein
VGRQADGVADHGARRDQAGGRQRIGRNQHARAEDGGGADAIGFICQRAGHPERGGAEMRDVARVKTEPIEDDRFCQQSVFSVP